MSPLQSSTPPTEPTASQPSAPRAVDPVRTASFEARLAQAAQRAASDAGTGATAEQPGDGAGTGAATARTRDTAGGSSATSASANRAPLQQASKLVGEDWTGNDATEALSRDEADTANASSDAVSGAPSAQASSPLLSGGATHGPDAARADSVAATDAASGATIVDPAVAAQVERMAAAVAEMASQGSRAEMTITFPAEWRLADGAVLARAADGRLAVALVGVAPGMAGQLIAGLQAGLRDRGHLRATVTTSDRGERGDRRGGRISAAFGR